MDVASINKILTDAGYKVLGHGGGAVTLEDPTCIIAAFNDFIDFAWIAIGGLTMLLLFGWAVALIRGAKMEIVDNMRNLFLLCGGLTAVPAVISLLIEKQVLECGKIRVSTSEITRILSLKERPGPAGPPAGMAMGMTDIDVGEMPATAMRTGTINGRRMVDLRQAVSAEDIATFRRVARVYGLRVRGCEAMGCGNIGARRVDNGPPQHAGTDLYRRPGDLIPAMFDGTVIGVAHKYSGLWGMTVRHDNGTTAHYGYVRSNGYRVGDRVAAGATIAIQQDLQMHPDYAGVPNHVHLELWNGNNRSVGDLINAEELF